MIHDQGSQLDEGVWLETKYIVSMQEYGSSYSVISYYVVVRRLPSSALRPEDPSPPTLIHTNYL
jgi:hypothetical protein